MASWGGDIIEHDSVGHELDRMHTRPVGLTDIDIHVDGTIIAGNRSGRVWLPDVDLVGLSSLPVTGRVAFVAFDDLPSQPPGVRYCDAKGSDTRDEWIEAIALV